MRACEACSREFTVARGGTMTCPFCGHNNAPSAYPRSLASLRKIEQDRQEREARENRYD